MKCGAISFSDSAMDLLSTSSPSLNNTVMNLYNISGSY